LGVLALLLLSQQRCHCDGDSVFPQCKGCQSRGELPCLGLDVCTLRVQPDLKRVLRRSLSGVGGKAGTTRAEFVLLGVGALTVRPRLAV